MAANSLSLDDGVLLERSRSGDAAALETLFRRYLPWLCAVGELMDIPSGAAETAALDVFARLWRERDAPLPPAPTPRALLYARVRTEALRLLEQSRNGFASPVAGDPAAPHTAANGATAQPETPHNAGRLRPDDELGALGELPLLPRLAFALRTLHGLDDAEVAAVLDSPVNEVRAHCADAVRQLEQIERERLAAPGPTTGTEPAALPRTLLHRWHPGARWDTDEAWIRLRARLRAQQNRNAGLWSRLRRRRRDALA